MTESVNTAQHFTGKYRKSAEAVIHSGGKKGVGPVAVVQTIELSFSFTTFTKKNIAQFVNMSLPELDDVWSHITGSKDCISKTNS